jgi:hypothetical protein
MADIDLHLPSMIPSEVAFGDPVKTYCSIVNDVPGTNIFVDSQLPAFVREDHPRFISFLEEYYRWLEMNGNVLSQVKKIKSFQDVDETDGTFVEKLYYEFFAHVPRSVVADKGILLKYIKQFYRAKGTEKSFRLFFRILFNADVQFYYPRTDVLKLSDGKWNLTRAIRVIPIRGTLADFSNKEIKGKLNGSSAFVNFAKGIREGLVYVYELNLNANSITGDFEANEIIETEDGSFRARISPVVASTEVAYDVTNRQYLVGAGYKVGDTFRVICPTSNLSRAVGAEVVVKSINVLNEVHKTGSIKKMEIIKIGAEYLDFETSLGKNNTQLKHFQMPLNGTNCISTNFTGQGASIKIYISGLAKYPGYYSNSDGHLSSAKYVQDGDFYQQFSYMTITSESTKNYNSYLKDLLHPLGLKFHGACLSKNHLLKKISSKGRVLRRLIDKTSNPFLPPVHRPLGAHKHGKTNMRIQHTTERDKNSFGLGASLRSIFRDRFRYKPYEEFVSGSEVTGKVADYWGNPMAIESLAANTPIDQFARLSPVELEHVFTARRHNIPRLSQTQMNTLSPAQLSALGVQNLSIVYNTTRRVLEMRTDSTWMPVDPFRRINIQPDAVVSTYGLPILDDSGNWTLNSPSVRAVEECGLPSITIHLDKINN